jgi:hypothetical protein
MITINILYLFYSEGDSSQMDWDDDYPIDYARWAEQEEHIAHARSLEGEDRLEFMDEYGLTEADLEAAEIIVGSGGCEVTSFLLIIGSVMLFYLLNGCAGW